MIPERRRKRSSFVGLALQYWLSSISRSKGLVGLVLAESSGLLVASSLRGPEAEELAALAPLLVSAKDQPGLLLQMDREPVFVHPFLVQESKLYVCALGERRKGREGARLAESGIKRILAR